MTESLTLTPSEERKVASDRRREKERRAVRVGAIAKASGEDTPNG